MPSFEEMAQHWGYHRWYLERDSANRFVRLWRQIGESNLRKADQITLTNVIWALEAVERASRVLEANVKRCQEAKNVGFPESLMVLTGPYQQSLDYQLGMSLWLDLVDVLIWYRAVRDRFRQLGDAAASGRIRLTTSEFKTEVDTLNARRIAEFGNTPAVVLADRLLHRSWHPAAPTVPFDLYWHGEAGQQTFGFTEQGDVLDTLFELVRETIEQVENLVSRLTQR